MLVLRRRCVPRRLEPLVVGGRPGVDGRRGRPCGPALGRRRGCWRRRLGEAGCRPWGDTAIPDLLVVVGDLGLKAARYAAATQYEQLFSKQQQLQVDISLKRGEAELVAEAELPTAPYTPKPARDAVLGAIVGLLLGLGIAFLREQLNDKVRSREELEELTGAAVIAEIPFDEEQAKAPSSIPVLERPNSALAESVRALRTSVQFLGVETPIRRLVLTSPTPGDGKTMVAVNLAVAYAQAGYETILVSADLRRPRLNEMFDDLPPGEGLTTLIAQLARVPRIRTKNNGSNGSNGSVTPGSGAESDPALRQELVWKSLLRCPIPNLLLLPSGPTPPNPSELLASKTCEEVFDALNEVADILIIDSPPVLAVTDAVIIGAKADGVIVVSSIGKTKRADSLRAHQTLDGANVRILGSLVNRSMATGKSGYYDYTGEPTDGKKSKGPNARQNQGDSSPSQVTLAP